MVHHAANAGLRLRFGPQHRPRMPPLSSPDDVNRPYETLGTHPDLVARLWDQLPTKLPVDCRMIFYGVPALVHPTSGIVFGFATGTHTYGLRLPEPDRTEALRAGATRIQHYPVERSFDLDEIGPEWVFCGWFDREDAWCLSAFHFAGSSD